MIQRASNWPTILANFLEERRAMPFAWGSNDCCLFAADWVKASTGEDLAEFLRGRYNTALGAMRVLERRGGVRGIMRLTAEASGMVQVNGMQCQRGDLVIADTGNGESIGICVGSHAAFVGKNGLLFAPFDFQRAAHCWHF